MVDRRVRDGLVGGASRNLIGSVVSAGSAFAVTILITRSLEAEAAGLTLVCFAAVALLSRSLTLGSGEGLNRFTQLVEADASQSLRRLRRVALLPPISAALLFSVAALGITGLLSGIVGAPLTDGLRVGLALLIPIATTVELLQAGLRAHGSMVESMWSNVARSVVQLVAVVWAVTREDPSPATVLLAWSAGPAAILVPLAVRYRSRTDALAAPAPSMRSYWSYSSLRAVASTCQSAIERVDVLLLSGIAGPAVAGSYAAMTRLNSLTSMPAMAAKQATIPGLSTRFDEGDLVGVEERIRAASVLTLVLSLPVLSALLYHGDVVLTLYGDGYAEAAPALTWIMIGLIFSYLAGPADAALNMAGHAGRSLVYVGVALAVNVGLNLWLIPRIGMTGAGVAWCVTMVLRNGVVTAFLWSRYSVLACPLWLVRWVGSTLVVFGVGAVLAELAVDDDLRAAALGVVLGGLGFVALTLAERRRISDALPGLRRTDP